MKKLVRRFKDEAVAEYTPEGASVPGDFKRYVVSTCSTRDLMSYPGIINCDFTNLMQDGITNALKGINMLDRISEINSRSVNVYHILRGGLNFRVVDALKKAFGYKWHTSSYISSQRVLKEGRFEVSNDSYRKFVLPDNPTVHTADIVAPAIFAESRMATHSVVEYLDVFLDSCLRLGEMSSRSEEQLDQGNARKLKARR